MLEAVTGRIEFGGSAVEAAIARLSRNPDIPDALGHYWCSLLKSMTARDPDQRPTAAEVSAALLEYRWSVSEEPVAVPVPPVTQGEGAGEGQGEMAEDGEPTADGGVRTAEGAIRREPESEPHGVSAVLAPPLTAPRVGRSRPRSAAAGQVALAVVPGRPSKLALVGRSLLGFVAMAVLALAVIVVADRLGIFPQDQGYPAVPGQLGEHLRELQESVTP